MLSASKDLRELYAKLVPAVPHEAQVLNNSMNESMEAMQGALSKISAEDWFKIMTDRFGCILGLHACLARTYANTAYLESKG